jgi:hypothetical protein
MSTLRRLEAALGGGFFGNMFIPEALHMPITPDVQLVRLVNFLFFIGCVIHGIIASDHGSPEKIQPKLNISRDITDRYD